ncbi:MAG TPA: FUSC family protein, partial [Candidatus Binataceae bacterium]|nr:FUSC family protein [Candidatus Binataceae bacterium]
MSSGAIPFIVTPKVRRAERYGALDKLQNLLARELAPTPRKFRLAFRISLIGTMGAALIAICHVNNELGTYIVWLLVGAGPMLTLRKASVVLAMEGVALAASVVIARAFAETPWLMLPFIFFLFSSSTYIGTVVKLGAALTLIQVVCIDLFYAVIFAPREIGWQAAGAFSGSALAFGLLLVFDNVIWPERGEPLLMEALAVSLSRGRARLVRATDFYLGRPGAVRPKLPPPTSDLPAHTALLDQVVAEGVDEHRHAILLAAITRTARISLEIDRLIVAARASVPGVVQAILGPEIQVTVNAIVAALDELVSEMRTQLLVGVDSPPPPARIRARLAMDALIAKVQQLRPVYIGRATSAEVEQLAAFHDSLAWVTTDMERLFDEPPPSIVASQPEQTASPSSGQIDPAILRHSLKVALCAVIGYLVGISAQRAELATILTTVLITALPTYGAAFRKMVLRIVGAALGGAISLVAIIIVSPNFETLPAYLMATFVVFYVSAYSSLSSGRVAYAGKQIGTTFALVFSGLSPSLDIYGPLWRIWGILLGTFVVAVIALILWPQYAGDSLLPRLRRVIADTLALTPAGANSGSEHAILEANSDTMRILAEMLQIADDAQLEGRTSIVNHEAIVQATGTLRRIANRLASIAASRLVTRTPELDSMTESSRAAVLDEVRLQLGAWLDFFANSQSLLPEAALALAQAQLPIRLEEPLAQFGTRIEEQGFARINSWTHEQRRAILAELHSLRRIAVLLPELNG